MLVAAPREQPVLLLLLCWLSSGYSPRGHDLLHDFGLLLTVSAAGRTCHRACVVDHELIRRANDNEGPRLLRTERSDLLGASSLARS